MQIRYGSLNGAILLAHQNNLLVLVGLVNKYIHLPWNKKSKWSDQLFKSSQKFLNHEWKRYAIVGHLINVGNL